MSADLQAEVARLRAALQSIVNQSERASNAWEPHVYPTEASKTWHEGYVTATAHFSLVAREALDPATWEADNGHMMLASHGSDREWFELTGNCGACGMPADWCTCTVDRPCGCGPHETAPWPRDCWRCAGTGKIQLRPAPVPPEVPA